MALAAILQMVKNRLPFIPADNSLDATINSFILEQFYYLQKWTGIDNNYVEDEAQYTGLQKMLVAELVCYELLERKTIENVGGVNGSAPSGAKRIKKGKADVVEAEFDYAKASDGGFLGATATELMKESASRACDYAATLGYTLPLCQKLGLCPALDVPPFLAFENPNL